MKESKFSMNQKVYLPYISGIETKRITGIIKEQHAPGFMYFLDHDRSYYYYEDKLYDQKDDAKQYLLEGARKDYFCKVKNILGDK